MAQKIKHLRFDDGRFYVLQKMGVSENGWFFPQPNDHGNFGKMRFKPMKFGGTDFGTD